MGAIIDSLRHAACVIVPDHLYMAPEKNVRAFMSEKGSDMRRIRR